MRRLATAVFVLLAAPAHGATVDAQFDSFSPSRVDVLVGETVRWQNVSDRTHTVTGAFFDSGDLIPGAQFERAFPEAGTHVYGCVLHPTMTGEVAVAPVLLDPLPVLAVPAGDPVVFSGRTTGAGVSVRVERAAGESWVAVATTRSEADGTWRATTPAEASGEHRAVVAAGASRTRGLLVSDRRVVVERVPGGVAVSVEPPLPYARIALQRDLRDRFGWWTVRRVKLDYLSQARFRLRGRAAARVALLADDGWRALALSPVLGRPRPAPPAPIGPGHTS